MSLSPAKSPTEIQHLVPADQASTHEQSLHIAPFPHDNSHKSRTSSIANKTMSIDERTPLLTGPYTHASRQEDSPLQEEPPSNGLATLSYFLAALFSYANWSLFTLTALSTVHFSVAANLPSHRSSTFLPLWISFLAGLTTLLHLLDFAFPERTPTFAARILTIANAVLLLATLLIVSLVKELRIKESILTIIVIAIAFVSYVIASIRPRLANNPAPFYKISQVHKSDHEEPGSGWEKFKHALKTALSLLTITFPIFLIHLLIFLCSLSILINICLRAYDASLPAPGEMIWVNPSKWHFGTYGLIEGLKPTSWLAFRLHLDCRGGDDWEGRTILYESPASRPGSTGADWLNTFVRQRTNHSIRYCTYDRPGYGFSDNSASASFELVSRALEEALDKNGEYSRVSKPNGGFVLVGDGYGGVDSYRMLSRVFAARNSNHTHSMLFLDPQVESSYFSTLRPNLKRDLTFFVGDVIGSLLTPLGLRRYAAIFFSKSSSLGNRESRVYGTAANGLSSTFARSALQQAHESHTDSQSWRSLLRSDTHFPSKTPSIVISSSDRLKQHKTWREGHENLAYHVLGKGLVRWEQIRGGHRVCEDSKEGSAVCSKALEDLLTSKRHK